MTSCAVATSQSMIVASALDEATSLPSGLNATECTPAVCPRNVARSRPSTAFQSLTVLSELAVASVWPSGFRATEKIPSEGDAVMVARSRLVAMSQSLTVPSKAHDASVLLSELKDAQQT